MNTPTNLGAALDDMARDGIGRRPHVSRVAHDYKSASTALALAYQFNASAARLASLEGQAQMIAGELIQTETGQSMLALIERTTAMHVDAPDVNPRQLVFASFRRVLGMPD